MRIAPPGLGKLGLARLYALRRLLLCFLSLRGLGEIRDLYFRKYICGLVDDEPRRGVNFHGPYEFVSIQVMEKAMEVILQIVQKANHQ